MSGDFDDLLRALANDTPSYCPTCVAAAVDQRTLSQLRAELDRERARSANLRDDMVYLREVLDRAMSVCETRRVAVEALLTEGGRGLEQRLPQSVIQLRKAWQMPLTQNLIRILAEGEHA